MTPPPPKSFARDHQAPLAAPPAPAPQQAPPLAPARQPTGSALGLHTPLTAARMGHRGAQRALQGRRTRPVRRPDAGPQPLSPDTARAFQRATGHDVTDVHIHPTPDLARDGHRGAAVRGQHVELLPDAMTDPRLLFHELIHIIQQRAASEPPARAQDPAPAPTQDPVQAPQAADRAPTPADPEAEAVAGAAAILAGQPFQVTARADQARLYSDDPEGDTSFDDPTDAQPACMLEGDTGGGDAPCPQPADPLQQAVQACEGAGTESIGAEHSGYSAEVLATGGHFELQQQLAEVRCVQGKLEQIIQHPDIALTDADAQKLRQFIDALGQHVALVEQKLNEAEQAAEAARAAHTKTPQEIEKQKEIKESAATLLAAVVARPHPALLGIGAVSLLYLGAQSILNTSSPDFSVSYALTEEATRLVVTTSTMLGALTLPQILQFPDYGEIIKTIEKTKPKDHPVDLVDSGPTDDPKDSPRKEPEKIQDRTGPGTLPDPPSPDIKKRPSVKFSEIDYLHNLPSAHRRGGKRIPPSVEYKVHVDVYDLPHGDIINLGSNSNSERGIIEFISHGSNMNIASSCDFHIKGTAQTLPNKSALQIIPTYYNSEIESKSKPFKILTLPNACELVGKNRDINDVGIVGMDVIMGFCSDSADKKDLDQVSAREKVYEHIEGSNLFLEYSTSRPLSKKINEQFLPTHRERYDSHAIQKDWVYSSWGWGKITTYQSYECKDLRSGSTGTVPHSGFKIVKSITAQNASCEEYSPDEREYFIDLLFTVEKTPTHVSGEYATESGIGSSTKTEIKIPRVSAKIRGRQDFKDFDIDYSKVHCVPYE